MFIIHLLQLQKQRKHTQVFAQLLVWIAVSITWGMEGKEGSHPCFVFFVARLIFFTLGSTWALKGLPKILPSKTLHSPLRYIRLCSFPWAWFSRYSYPVERILRASSLVPNSLLLFFNVRFFPPSLLCEIPLPLALSLPSFCARVQLATAGELIIAGIVIIIISLSPLLERHPASAAAALIAVSGASCPSNIQTLLGPLSLDKYPLTRDLYCQYKPCVLLKTLRCNCILTWHSLYTHWNVLFREINAQISKKTSL